MPSRRRERGGRRSDQYSGPVAWPAQQTSGTRGRRGRGNAGRGNAPVTSRVIGAADVASSPSSVTSPEVRPRKRSYLDVASSPPSGPVAWPPLQYSGAPVVSSSSSSSATCEKPKVPASDSGASLGRELAENVQITPETTTIQPGFEIVEIARDGNCLFKALSHQLEAHQRDYAEIRRSIVYYMGVNPSTFQDFLRDGSGSIDDYCARMANDGIWGGNQELYAAANIFDCRILLHMVF